MLSLLALAGCSASEQPSDPLQVTDQLTAAVPPASPPVSTPPAGRLIPAPPVQNGVWEPATSTLVTSSDSRLLLWNGSAGTDMLDAPRQVPLPGAPASLAVGSPGVVWAALPAQNQLARVDVASGQFTLLGVDGGPVHAAETPQGLSVTLGHARSVVLVEPGSGRVISAAAGFTGPALTLPGPHGVHVLDRLATSLTPVEFPAGEKKAGLRAGEGAGQAVRDRFGRILVADVRGGALLALHSDPFVLAQRYPLGAAPDGLAFEQQRDLAWLSLPGSNEVVGLAVAAGEPEQRFRFPSVHQPHAVAVDPTRGRVFVASASGAGIQVLTCQQRCS